MKAEQDYEIDIRDNKIKEGFLIKRSRILKEWKQRWMVLTRTHLYSFIQKQVYKKPTQKIPLKEVSTIKSYYKNQYNRPQVIRIQSQDADFYLSAKNHQEKWAWMTAVEKMTDMSVCPQQQATDSQNLIRETLRMTTAIRNTINLKSQKKDNIMTQSSSDMPKDFLKKLKLLTDSNTSFATIIPSPQAKQKESPIQQKKQQKTQNSDLSKSHPNKTESQKTQKAQQVKVVQKIVYVPEIKQKIVYVPQIKEVIKTVFVEKNHNNNGSLQNGSTDKSGSGTILQLFQHVMQMKCENPKPLIEFIVFLMFSEPQRYTQIVLKFACSPHVQHAFSNAFLQVLNEQIDQTKLNAYLKFVMVLYQNNYEYFYMNDLKLLIEILIRQIEMNRSYLNQFLIIGVINVMADKKWWNQVKHRRDELVTVVTDVKAWTSDPQTKFAAQELLQKL